MITVRAIAMCCHEANKALCEGTGDFSQRSWEKAEEWQRNSAIKGVEYFMENPAAPDSAQHDAWVQDKFDAGWVYGEVKDSEAKTHPCMVPFEDLPPEQQAKDTLFKAVCKSLVPLIEV
jgi:hypothetical protein